MNERGPDAYRFLFVGGGTGGHLTPALGIAEALEARGHDCYFLVSGRAVERGYFEGRPGHASLGVDSSRLPRALALVPAALRLRRHARGYRPHVLVALGGASSAAVLGWRRAPRVLLEGNRVPGRAVRWMQRGARATLTLFPETAAELPTGRWVGPVGRASLVPPDAAAARARLGLHAAGPVLLAAGGSQGAQAVNQLAARMLPRLAELVGQLLALTGPGNAEELRQALAASGVHGVVLEHCSDMGAAYAAADFAVLRGGASTMAELLLTRLPAAVLPYPHHADRQQEHNARALEPGVCCFPGAPEDADALVAGALADPLLRERMRAALVALAPGDGAARAADVLEEIAASNP